jgi:anti-sigma-K factor RskA
MTHQELIDSAASYALDALDPGKRVAFEAHLATCAECQAEVAAYREVAGALANAAPQTVIPHSDKLRERILREARKVRPITSAPSAAAVLASPSVQSKRRSTIPWAVAIASLAAAIVIGFVYRGQRSETNALRAELAEAKATLAREDSTLAAFLGPEVHVVSLMAPDAQKPALRVFWNHTKHTFIVTALNLAPAPSGKTYQLWALRKGQPPMSMGTFDPNANGRTMATLAVAQPITDGGFIDDCALTVEPSGGSPQPTESPRLIGSWRHVD